ncbi:hypothetical protein IKQ21_00240, partial [bacterium]|nr:hypothetical protein [bacterium]
KHAQIIRDHLPHSPAKSGPLKDLRKVKIIETVASTMKPQPLVSAMNKTLGVITNPSLKVKLGFDSTPTFKVNPKYNIATIPDLNIMQKNNVIQMPQIKAPKYELPTVPQLKVVNKSPDVLSTSTLNKQTQFNKTQNSKTTTNSSVINYNPTIYFTGTATKDDFKQMLKQHKEELLRLLKAESERKVRLAY